MKCGAIFDMDGTLVDTEKFFRDAWIETADSCYAMSNAAPNVKAVAKHICLTNNEDGVLVELEKIFGGD